MSNRRSQHGAHQSLRHWPASSRLAAWWSRDWKILAVPARTTTVPADATPARALALLAKAGLNAKLRTSRGACDPSRAARVLIGWLSYDLGALLEPKAVAAASPTPARTTARRDRDWPLAVIHECGSGRVFDRSGTLVKTFGKPPTPGDEENPVFSLRPADPGGRARRRYVRGVERVLAYIRAGDAYQVNLAHRLRAEFSGSPRALFAALVRAADPRYGAYIEDPGGAVASVSPELMLSYDPREGLLRSCPMKGTARDAAVLRRSEKDKAELAMIVDLVRNDLGRVARPGGVRVEVPRAIERHARGGAGIAQATASVVAGPNPATTWLDVLRAFFPAGSVTGAPKIRAMQIIDELEEARRGPYCGSAFLLCDTGYFASNVAIRTACVRAGVLDWWVGAGIVADSDPAREWDETLVKAGVIRSVRTS